MMPYLPYLAVIVAALLVTVCLKRVPSLGVPETETDSGGDVDVIIPARNEAVTLPGLLADLQRQTLAVARVVVVDDDSSDDTAAIATAGGAYVVPCPSRPPGWNPKVWALHVGVRHSDAARMVFLDADVRLAGRALEALVGVAASSGGLVSVAPYHCRLDDHDEPAALGAVESLSAPFNVVIDAGGGPGFGRQAAGAVGSCLTMTRDDYDACGGHAATPGTIVDDLSLASTAHAAGLSVTLLQSRVASRIERNDRPLVTVRSYPGGFGELQQGWIKNLSAGLGHTPIGSTIAVGTWITALLLPFAMAVQSRWITAVGLWALVALHTGWLTSQVGRFQPLVVTVGAPFLGLWFATVSVLSGIARITRRRVSWKGRSLRPDGVEG